MNIFILTLGSRGDVQPFVDLGKGLQAAGHTVTVATSASFKPFITGHGLHYGYLNNELLDLTDTAEGRAARRFSFLSGLSSVSRSTTISTKVICPACTQSPRRSIPARIQVPASIA